MNILTLETMTATVRVWITDDNRVVVEIDDASGNESIVLGRNDVRALIAVLASVDMYESAGRAPGTNALTDARERKRTLVATGKNSGESLHDRYDLAEITIRNGTSVAARTFLDHVDRKQLEAALVESVETAYQAA